MARKVRDARLETRQARLRLPEPANREPYWRLIHPGLHLGYRKAPRGGVWMVRFKRGDKYVKKVLGHADDFQDSNGSSIISYTEAQKAAQQYVLKDFSPLTVRKAAENYLAWFKDHRKAYKETSLNVHAHILPAFGDRVYKKKDMNPAFRAVRRRSEQTPHLHAAPCLLTDTEQPEFSDTIKKGMNFYTNTSAGIFEHHFGIYQTP